MTINMVGSTSSPKIVLGNFENFYSTRLSSLREHPIRTIGSIHRLKIILNFQEGSRTLDSAEKTDDYMLNELNLKKKKLASLKFHSKLKRQMW